MEVGPRDVPLPSRPWWHSNEICHIPNPKTDCKPIPERYIIGFGFAIGFLKIDVFSHFVIGFRTFTWDGDTYNFLAEAFLEIDNKIYEDPKGKAVVCRSPDWKVALTRFCFSEVRHRSFIQEGSLETVAFCLPSRSCLEEESL